MHTRPTPHTRPTLHLARKLMAAVAVSFFAATTMTGVTAGPSSADGDTDSVVHAGKEWKRSLDVTRTKEW